MGNMDTDDDGDDYGDDDDGRSSPAETVAYAPLSPSEDDDDDGGKNTADCLLNAAYNCYTQMHKLKNALIYAMLFIAGKCVMRLFVYLFIHLFIYTHILRIYVMCKNRPMQKKIDTEAYRQQYLCRQ